MSKLNVSNEKYIKLADTDDSPKNERKSNKNW
jgi:hypothetical protein